MAILRDLRSSTDAMNRKPNLFMCTFNKEDKK